MRDELQQLAARNQVLDAHDDRISEQITAIEEALRHVFKTRISVDISADRSLDFGKFNGKWCLLHYERDIETPLLSCSREIRADLVCWIEPLIRCATDQIDAQISTRLAAIEVADRLLTALRSA